MRDALLGRPCADVDIATSASWQAAQRAFEDAGCRTHETGTAHGTVTAVVGGTPVEVTTYRVEGAYGDARHPSQVSFVRNIEEDLARRDFTVNALAYHPARGLLDPFGGAADLEAGALRAVGDPQERFGEDALRILRACRFASQLGFAIEDETYDALLSHKHLLARISAERVTHELDGFVRGAFVHDALMRTVDVLAAVLPELVAMKGFDQRSPYHIYDVLEHTAWTLHHAPEDPLVRWRRSSTTSASRPRSSWARTALATPTGMPPSACRWRAGAFQRLRLPSAFCDRVTTLIAHHDDVLEPTPKAVKRTIARMGGDPSLFAALCKLKRADALAHGPGCADRVLLAGRLEETLSRVLADGEAFCRKKLALGRQRRDVAGRAGRTRRGRGLAAALDAVIDDEVENDPASLAAFVRGWAAEQADLARRAPERGVRRTPSPSPSPSPAAARTGGSASLSLRQRGGSFCEMPALPLLY